MKKQIILLSLALILPQAIHAGWGNDFSSTTSTYRVSASITPQNALAQIKKLMATRNISQLVRGLESLGEQMPEIMQAAQHEGTAAALRAQCQQLVSSTRQLIARQEPNRTNTVNKMLAIIYANHPPAQAHAPEHAPCHRTLTLGWRPGALEGLWEQYVEGTPHAANLITFCSTCMRSLRVILDDAARRKQECTQLQNALWQFEQQL